MFRVTCTACDAPGPDHILTEARARELGAKHCVARGCPTDAIEVEVAGDV